MQIAIIGDTEFKNKLKPQINNRFIEIAHFFCGIEILNSVRKKTHTWDVILIQEVLPDLNSLSLKSLLDYSLPTTQNVLIKSSRLECLYEHLSSFDLDLSVCKQKNLCKMPKYIVYNHARHVLYQKGKATKLCKKEWELLNFLMQSKGKILSIESILEAVWGHKLGHCSRTLSTHINHLRAKLDQKLLQIKTVPKKGYILLQANC